MKILLIRHKTAPTPEGCRWCGIPSYEHGQRHTPAKRWHSYTSPTKAQIQARARARRNMNQAFSMPGNDPAPPPLQTVASATRTQL